MDESLVPEGFRCAITADIMSDPVFSCDGHTYERAAIEDWFRKASTSPNTGAHLPSTHLVPNFALRKSIEEMREKLARGGWNIDAHRVEIGQKEEDVIGRGAWGLVRKSLLLAEHGRKVPVAVKSLCEATAEQERKAFDAELKVLGLATVRCQGVCRLLGTTVKEGRMHIVMKLYQGCLAKQLEQEGCFHVPKTLDVLRQVARSVAELHSQDIVIGDLKPSNILYDQFGTYVIADFGMSRVVDGTRSRFLPTSVQGTVSYMAPEQFEPEQYGGIGKETDMWSLACIVCEMVCGKHPWKGLQMPAIMRKVCNGQHPPLPDGIPPSVSEAMERCFAASPKERPSAQEVLVTVTEAIAQQHQSDAVASLMSESSGNDAGARWFSDDELREIVSALGGSFDDRARTRDLVAQASTLASVRASAALRPARGVGLSVRQDEGPILGVEDAWGTHVNGAHGEAWVVQEAVAALSIAGGGGGGALPEQNVVARGVGGSLRGARRKATQVSVEERDKARACAAAKGLFRQNIEETVQYGRTPLHLAAQDGRVEDVVLLMRAGANIGAANPSGNDGNTPLHLAARNEHCEVVRELVVAGADLEATNNHGDTPLHLAAHNGCLKTLKELVGLGADRNAISNTGSTPLHQAARIGHPDCVEALLAAAAHVNPQDENGNTPLHLAAHNGLSNHAEAVRELLLASADRSVRNADGKTALDVATYKDTVAMLRSSQGPFQ